MTDIIKHLNSVRHNIEAAYQASARERRFPTLIAVSKTKPVENIIEAWNAGQRDFGENKIQEAQEKFSLLRVEKKDLVLHMIGHLQTNKVAEAVRLFDVIHSLDSLKLAKALLKEMHKQERYPDVLVQVNTGKEPQKSGIFPEATPEFTENCQQMGLPIKGLMCIPPVNENPESHFSLLSGLAQKLSLPELSMGMSEDYRLAIQYNATYVRIGSAIFGPR